MNSVEKPLVSVILPTYNVERFLRKCLESIKNSRYTNLEVIVVIDGATDNSLLIAEEFAREDSRFSVFFQENAGAGPARNLGLGKASGEYVIFIDPDDWIDADYIDKFVEIQKKYNPDFITSYLKNVLCDADGKILKVETTQEDFQLIDKVERVRNNYCLLKSKFLLGAPHSKMYKMKIIRENNICFPNLRRSQDIVFNLSYYNFVSRLCIAENSGYNYRIIFAERLARIKRDYYKTAALIYQMTKSTLESWNVTDRNFLIDKDFLNTLTYVLESMVASNISLKEMFYDEQLKNIVSQSHVISVQHKIIKFLYLHKMELTLNFLLGIKHLLKKTMRRF